MEDPPCLHAPHLPRSHTLVPSAAQAMLRSPARRPYWIGVNTSMPLSVRPWSPPRHLNPDGRARGRGGGDHAGLKPPAEADLGGRLGEGEVEVGATQTEVVGVWDKSRGGVALQQEWCLV